MHIIERARFLPSHGMGWDGTGMNCHGMGWDGTEKYVPWTSLPIPSLSRQGAALAYLDSLPPHDLVFWTDGFVPFPLGKGDSVLFANCFLRGTEAILTFSGGPV